MASLLAIERFLPPYRYGQEEVTGWVRAWLDGRRRRRRRPPPLRLRLGRGEDPGQRGAHRGGLPPPATSSTQNDRYRRIACEAGMDLARRALARGGAGAGRGGPGGQRLLHRLHDPGRGRLRGRRPGHGPAPRAPAHHGERVRGRRGGPGAGRGLPGAPTPSAAALVLALEFSSLTFQRWDRSATNVVSTAIFGDGGRGGGAGRARPSARPRAAAGARSWTRRASSSPAPRTSWASTCGNQGLQIILDRDLAPFVRREVVGGGGGLPRPARPRAAQDVDPVDPAPRRPPHHRGDERAAGPRAEDLAPTEAVLAEHGNMSSVTVLFVLDEILRRRRPAPGRRASWARSGPASGRSSRCSSSPDDGRQLCGP